MAGTDSKLKINPLGIIPALAAGLGLAWGSANAQEPSVCMSADDMEAGLIDWYGEHALTQSADGTLVLWKNLRSGSWTIVSYLANGEACAIDSGEEGSLPPATLPRNAGLIP